MSFHNRFSKQFTKEMQESGSNYFWGKRVHIEIFSDNSIEAIVRESENYQVNLKLVSNELYVSCECLYFRDYQENCKHIWATILAAEQNYLLGAIHEIPGYYLNLVPDFFTLNSSQDL